MLRSLYNIFHTPKCPLRKIKDPTQGKKTNAKPSRGTVCWQWDKTARTWMIHWHVRKVTNGWATHHQKPWSNRLLPWARIGIQTRGSLFSHMRRCFYFQRWYSGLSSPPITTTSSALSRWDLYIKKRIRYNPATKIFDLFLRGSECNTKNPKGSVHEIQSTVGRFRTFDLTVVTKKARTLFAEQ